MGWPATPLTIPPKWRSAYDHQRRDHKGWKLVGRPPRLWSIAPLSRLITTTDTHGQYQSRSLHHPPRNRRHVRRGHLDPLDCDRGRHGHPGKRRQRVRRRRRHRLHLAGGRAAPEWSRLREVLEPAIAYARDGYPFLERAAATVKTVEQLFRKYWTTSAAVYLPNNEVPQPGSIFTNAKLAETYTRILKEAESAGGDREAQIEGARKAWSKGFVAEAIDKFCRPQDVMYVSGSPHRGVLSADAMARWQPTIEAPLTYDYGRYTVCKAGVWSQGPVMLQQLALLKGFKLDGLDPTGPEFIHTQIECAKLAYADREKFYGDPKFVEVPIGTLLSDAYNDERRKLISDKASLEFIPGSVEGFGGVVKLRRQEGQREAVGAMGAGEPTVGRFGEVRGDTVHFDIIDQAGNVISATPSGGWLQSSPVIPELGFCLGSRAQMFWLEQDHPAALAPGKRPRTTLSPTMALRDGEPYLSWGSPG